MKTISELLSPAEYLFLVSKPIPEGNVLEAVLVNLLILSLVMLFPVFDHFCAQFLASSTEDSVLGYAALELFKLVLDLLALLLFFVEFVLQLACHAVVPILSLFEVESDLVNVG